MGAVPCCPTMMWRLEHYLSVMVTVLRPPTSCQAVGGILSASEKVGRGERVLT